MNEKLLNAIPADANRVLEVLYNGDSISEKFKLINKTVQWDTVLVEENIDISTLNDKYDVIIFDNVLENIADPDKFLKMTFDLCNPTGKLICRIKNMSHINIIQQLLSGDMSEVNVYKKFITIPSAYKLLLNSGWLPNLKDYDVIEHETPEFVSHIVSASINIGIPQEVCARNIFIDQFIIDCTKTSYTINESLTPFSVVVAVNNAAQFNINILESPGLKEINAEIIPVTGAKNAAEAFDIGKKQASHKWILYCHQDVYFPVGSGKEISKMLATVADENINTSLFGFAGLSTNSGAYSGLVIDRTSRFDFNETSNSISIDEFAVILSSESIHKIDPELGWHCWGTDLCINANYILKTKSPKILRISLFHNSLNNSVLTPEYYNSAVVLKNKYPALPIIPTLNGDIK